MNFDLSGKIFTKWLYRNNDKMGVLSLGNPFWPDSISGDNGVATEFELQVVGKVGKHVEAGVRIKSRFGALWQDWWENGDLKANEDTSGESLGLNRAQYMKLRGYWIRASLPFPYLESVLIGSSDLGMFNEWTIGKIRYIDRDNGKGIFVQGAFHERYFKYHFGIIALPKLWVGPGWSTGVGDPLLRTPFYSQDWAYGLRLESEPFDGARLTVIGTLTRDSEIDRTDPDAVGSLYPTCQDELGNHVPGCAPNGAVDTFNRYSNAVVTGELQIDTWSGGSFNFMGGWSYSTIDKRLANNGVATNEGVFPLVYDDVHGAFARVRAELFDLGGASGLTLKLEYFFVDEHFTTMFGARREGDVLWTDGFVEGGQLPTLNLANEFIDFDEGWYESIVGWHGATLILEYGTGVVDLLLEGTFITYDTNAQNRDVDQVYPTFLHSEGFTDTDLYDYANVFDRGRDPRSVYRRNQDRRTVIARAQAKFATGLGRGLDVGIKAKLIWDQDLRKSGRIDDDYTGLLVRGKVWLQYPAFEGFQLTVGGVFDYWDEENRNGSLDKGYSDDLTIKAKPYLDLRYTYENLHIHYYLEYVYKDAQRQRGQDREFHIIRSKATVEVSW